MRPDYSEIKQLERQLKQYTWDATYKEQLSQLYEAEQDKNKAMAAFKKHVITPENVLIYIQPGRLIHVRQREHDYGWGAVTCFRRHTNPVDGPETIYVLDVAVRVANDCEGDADGSGDMGRVRPSPEVDAGIIMVVPFTLDCVQAVSTIRMKIPDNLNDPEARKALGDTIVVRYKVRGGEGFSEF